MASNDKSVVVVAQPCSLEPSVAAAGDVGARVDGAAALHFLADGVLALLAADDGQDAPSFVATHFVRAVTALRLSVPSTRDTDALFAIEALEGVPVLLAWVEVRLVGHAGGVLGAPSWKPSAAAGDNGAVFVGKGQLHNRRSPLQGTPKSSRAQRCK